MCLLKQDKEEQLKELTLIVSGIRLFNKNNSRGGEAVRNGNATDFDLEISD